jgi:hypothetical protein
MLLQWTLQSLHEYLKSGKWFLKSRNIVTPICWAPEGWLHSTYSHRVQPQQCHGEADSRVRSNTNISTKVQKLGISSARASWNKYKTYKRANSPWLDREKSHASSNYLRPWSSIRLITSLHHFLLFFHWHSLHFCGLSVCTMLAEIQIAPCDRHLITYQHSYMCVGRAGSWSAEPSGQTELR